MGKLTPACILEGKPHAYTNQGSLMPCCWLDREESLSDPYLKQFYEMRVSDYDDLSEIFKSELWVEFYKTLENEPDKAHKLCWDYCSKDKDPFDGFELELDNIIATDGAPKCSHGMRMFLGDKNEN